MRIRNDTEQFITFQIETETSVLLQLNTFNTGDDTEMQSIPASAFLCETW